MSDSLKVLHFAHGLASYNNSLLELSNCLDAAGMNLMVASHIDLSETLRDAPCKFELLRHDDAIANRLTEERNRYKAKFRLERLMRSIVANRRFRQESLNSAEVEDLVARFKPDLLLIDMECHVAILRTRVSLVPTLLCSRWFSVFKSRDLPPMHTSLLPPLSSLARWQVRVAWARLAIHKFSLNIRQRLSRRRFWPIVYSTNSRVDLAAVAQHCGLDLSTITETGHWLIPHVYKDLAVMSLTARCMEFDHADDPRMHYVGAMLGHASPMSAKLKSARATFEHFLADRRHTGNPLVYCSFSTFWATEGARIEPLIERFSKRSDIDLVMGLGGVSLPDKLAIPDNVLVLEFAPQLEVIHCADIMITHGGISSINEALRHGVPLIGVSGKQVDQNGCLARVLHHGLGVLSQSDLRNPDDILSLIDVLLSDEAADIRANVRRVQQALEAYEQEGAAAKLVREIAGQVENR